MGLPVLTVRARSGDESDDDEAASRVAGVGNDSAELRDGEFAALVERQSKLMFRVAYALLRNAHDAEDAVQEAFLKLYRGGAWRRMEDEKAFLARTVWRVALDRLPPKAGTMTVTVELNIEVGFQIF